MDVQDQFKSSVARLEQKVERLIVINKQLNLDNQKKEDKLMKYEKEVNRSRIKQQEVSVKLKKLLVRVQQLEAGHGPE